MIEPPTESALARLTTQLRMAMAFTRAARVLEWDQRTFMPPGGLAARADQLATLQRLAHAYTSDRRMGDLIERAADEVAARAQTTALARGAWIDARTHDDFALFVPWLRKTVEQSRRYADYLGYQDHPFDALLALTEPGLTTAHLRALFAELRPALIALIARIGSQGERAPESALRQSYDRSLMDGLARQVITRFGYDVTRGRLDRGSNAVEVPIARDDVRIILSAHVTTLRVTLSSALHEGGHGLYEQNIAPALDGLPLGRGASPSLHESQSLLWQNQVGCSRPFCAFLTPLLRAAFPDPFDAVDADDLYRDLNTVRPALIRKTTDEVTYCLQYMQRFELELALMEGALRPEDVQDAWDAAMRDAGGLTPPTKRLGILQAGHWYKGLGVFHTYALGAIIAAQLWEAALIAHPNVPEQVAQGEFGDLLTWLRTNVYRHGRKFDPSDLVQRATGAPIRVEPYVQPNVQLFLGLKRPASHPDRAEHVPSGG